MRKQIGLLLLAMAVPAASFARQPDTLRAGNLFGDLKARHIGPALMSGSIGDLEGHLRTHLRTGV